MLLIQLETFAKNVNILAKHALTHRLLATLALQATSKEQYVLALAVQAPTIASRRRNVSIALLIAQLASRRYNALHVLQVFTLAINCRAVLISVQTKHSQGSNLYAILAFLLAKHA